MATRGCDKAELYQSCIELLDFMEEELRREEFTLDFNDAWDTFIEYVDELGLELANDGD